MSIFLNDTKNGGVKFDCAKECPCGVPAIPVPDQWLEVMVTGGFKVWHIIFIIIAFVVTIIVVYCCFHRCRIPRTKQEIEADLMRTNMTNKFRDYLQEFPNEPTTFMDALKKVQELEEKSSEEDDPGARKRKVWLKLKGKDRQEKSDAAKDGPQLNGASQEAATVAPKSAEVGPPVPAPQPQQAPTVLANSSADDKLTAPETDKNLATDKNERRQAASEELASKSIATKPGDKESNPDLLKSASIDKSKTIVLDSKLVDLAKLDDAETREKAKVNEAKLVKLKSKRAEDKPVKLKAQRSNDKASSKTDVTTPPVKTTKVRRQRDKPNLSRTKAAHVGFRTDSTEDHNQLSLPTASHHHHHHHHHQIQPKQDSNLDPTTSASGEQSSSKNRERLRGKSRTRLSPTSKPKAKETKNSTVIQIET